jgi:hypothetical protein
MHCAGCGQMVSNERAVCPRCGRPAQAASSGGPGEAAALFAFGQIIRRLQQYWFLFACLNVALGVAGLVTAQLGWSHQFGPWEPWPHPPTLEWTYQGGSAWTLLIVRAALAAAAGLGLRNRTRWARLVTGIAAVMAFTQFPIGLVLGAYTLVRVLGKRNVALFKKFVVHSS